MGIVGHNIIQVMIVGHLELDRLAVCLAQIVTCVVRNVIVVLIPVEFCGVVVKLHSVDSIVGIILPGEQFPSTVYGHIGSVFYFRLVYGYGVAWQYDGGRRKVTYGR